MFITISLQNDFSVVYSYLIYNKFTVYVDWKISDNDRENPDKKICDEIQKSMQKCKNLIYLYTMNSKKSLWMPWEVGFFNGFHKQDDILIWPILQDHERYEKQEYLKLYNTIDMENLELRLRLLKSKNTIYN